MWIHGSFTANIAAIAVFMLTLMKWKKRTFACGKRGAEQIY